MTFITTLSRDEDEIEVTVEFTYHRAIRGYRNRFGVPEEPDEPEDVGIDRVTDVNGNEIDLTPKEQERIKEQAMEYHQEQKWDRYDND